MPDSLFETGMVETQLVAPGSAATSRRGWNVPTCRRGTLGCWECQVGSAGTKDHPILLFPFGQGHSLVFPWFLKPFPSGTLGSWSLWERLELQELPALL